MRFVSIVGCAFLYIYIYSSFFFKVFCLLDVAHVQGTGRGAGHLQAGRHGERCPSRLIAACMAGVSFL